MNKRSGFTLLELSIVLVIIGLIVGGVLVGKDLIEAAKLQRVVKEAQGFQNAVATFRLKYNALPGDMPQPESYFPDGEWNSGAYGIGDGVIYSTTEGADAWRQLALAQLIGAGNMEGSEHCGITSSSPGWCSTIIGVTGPGTRYKDSMGWYIGNSSKTGKNAVLLSTPGLGVNGQGSFWPQNEGPMLALAAQSIDQKIDDGRPNSGAVRAESDYGGCMDVPADSVDAHNGVYTLNPEGYGFSPGGCSLSFPLNM